MYYLEDAYGMTLSGRERERVKETTAKRDTNTKERRAHSRTYIFHPIDLFSLSHLNSRETFFFSVKIRRLVSFDI